MIIINCEILIYKCSFDAHIRYLMISFPNYSHLFVLNQCVVLLVQAKGKYAYATTGQSSGALRLVDYSSKFPASGRLEIFFNSQWGTVCSSGNTFTQLTADVACKQLGFSTALSWGHVNSEG